MKKIFYLLSIAALIISCSNDSQKDNGLVYNQKCVVRNKWISGRFSDHYLLISLAEDSMMVREWRTTDKIFWKKGIGDTVFFNFIRKDLFFKADGLYENPLPGKGN